MFKAATIRGEYRYDLTRCWDPGCEHYVNGICNSDNYISFIMLNPSTADADIDDPTIRRCMAFARSWGFSCLRVYNLFALRATDPKVLKRHPDPIGRWNDAVLSNIVPVSPDMPMGILAQTPIVCAWGNHGELLGRGIAVRSLIKETGFKYPDKRSLYHLGLTKAGHPKHPLYLRANTKLTEWI